MLTDAEIATLSAQQRRDLIQRLERPLEQVAGRPRQVQRMRRRRLAVVITAVIVLVPWIVYLAVTLPNHYVARHWSATWVGFDVLLLAGFVATAALGLLRRQLLVLPAFATGVLLICDAWFDVTTASSSNRIMSILSAALIELPVAVLLLTSAWRLLDIEARRMWLIPPTGHLWQVPLPLAERGVEPAASAHTEW